MSDALSALLHLSAHDYSWLAQFFSLLFLPFAHEDLAIILGAYVVVNDIMPVGLVALCIYGGMVASDFALYGIGAGARRLPWLSRLAVDDRVRNFTDMLKRNLFEIVALCRVVPGVVFVAFVACGWRRVPLARFTVASLVVSALSAAHALHRGLLRRHARWSCWLVDVAVPVLRVAGDRFRPSTGFQLPARAQAGRRRTADPCPAVQGRQGGAEGAHEGSHPARPVLPALDRELDSLCIAIRVSDAADGRQSVPSDGRDVGRIEKRLSARRRSERATMDRRFCDGDAQRRAAYVVRRPRAGSAIAVRRRAGVSADRQA